MKITKPPPPKVSKDHPPKQVLYPSGGYVNPDPNLPASQDNPSTPATHVPEGLNIEQVAISVIQTQDFLKNQWIKMGLQQCERVGPPSIGCKKCCVVFLAGIEEFQTAIINWQIVTGTVINRDCATQEEADRLVPPSDLVPNLGPHMIVDRKYYGAW